ncbi:MAG TPA: RsmE family RNA methyltransferase [Planctomycetota bacterium]|nr:RsmE family RNA methyltransferase [Planctomycetota bacterium]
MKVRRFRVPTLANVDAGAELTLPEDQARHARVLRLVAGTEVELFDTQGWTARGELLEAAAGTVRLRSRQQKTQARTRLRLAVPWPKGKRAAMLVEKCTELEVDELIPLRAERSVVSKDSESEGVGRLRRIADEAAKQSGRPDVPSISTEHALADVIKGLKDNTCAFVLDPSAEIWITSALEESFDATRHTDVLLLVGPEGGFSDREMQLLEGHGIRGIRVASHVLRVETAALAGCAVTRAFLYSKGAESAPS